jgi:GT2 family glycosyltransferase
MLARLKGDGPKTFASKGEKITLTGEFSLVPTIDFFEFLSSQKDVETLCRFDRRPLRGYDIRFVKPDTFVVSGEQNAVEIRAIPFVFLQSKIKTVSKYFFKIETTRHIDLGEIRNTDKPVKILVYRSLGGIGDIVMTFPVIELVKKRFPKSKITFSCPKQFLCLAKNNPFIDSLVPFSVSIVAPSLWDVSIDLTTECIDYERKTQPLVDLNRAEIFVKAAGFNPEETPMPKLYLSREEILLAKHETLRGLTIGVALESAAPARDWYEIESLIDILRENKRDIHTSVEIINHKLLVFAKEKPKWFNLEENEEVSFYFGRDLRNVTTLIGECDLFIGPDTGLSHIAAALDIPTIWLFTHIDGKIRTRNYRNSFVIQVTPEDCPTGGPCWYNIKCNSSGYQGNVSCSKAIKPEAVALKVKRVLEKPDVSYCVVYHNKLDVTVEAIKRILAFKKYNEEIVLLDNGTDEFSFDKLKEKFPSFGPLFKFMRNDKNNGAIEGRNQVLTAARGRFLFCPDNDQYISPETIHRLKVAGGDIAGVEGWFMDSKAWAYKMESILEEPSYVGIGGMYASWEVFQRVGFLDERYSPCWFDDPDFCFRSKRLGFSIALALDHGVEHKAHSTTGHQKKFDMKAAWVRSRQIFCETWFPNLTQEEITNSAPQSRIKISAKVVVIMPVHGRYEIATLTAKRLKERQTVKPILIITGEKENRKIASGSGADLFLERPNLPLWSKMSDAVFEASTMEPDALMVAGSDDVFCDRWIERGLKEIWKGKGFLAGSDIAMLDIRHRNPIIKKRFKGGYFDSGEMFSKKALEEIHWNLYQNTKDETLGHMRKDVMGMAGIIRKKIPQTVAMCIKGNWDMLNPIDFIENFCGSVLTMDFRDQHIWLALNFPGLVLELTKAGLLDDQQGERCHD